ncbi:MAG: hypothetical protein LRY40_01735 [Shewanella fodinae]|nr:hypothetical protein [Shewanella fodinae]
MSDKTLFMITACCRWNLVWRCITHCHVFFVTDKNNAQNAQRVYLGLVRAYEDGSFIRLWNRYF